jgi:nitrite reductase/ring-hydroxylating ferredoxin subunit
MTVSPATGFVRACSVEELKRRRRLVFKHGRRQIALFLSDSGVHACNNRCPHEGYPLSVGTLSQGCVLTCNWHNWKFDLASGETLVGGDRLRRYPVQLRDGSVWLDLTEAPAEERRAQALANLREAFDDYDYERIARELARLREADGDDLEGLAAAVAWSHDRLEFGTSHAQAAAPDWLALRQARGRGAARQLVPLVEAVAHFSWDSRREPTYPYPKRARRFDGRSFLAAVETEDEAGAVAHLRGALRDGLGYAALEPWLAQAALSHYQGFGHSIIYVYKTRQLAERLGPASLEPLLLPLTRHLLYARREDLIPEFRAYRRTLQGWDGQGMATARAADFQGVSVGQALERARAASRDRTALYHALLGALAWNFLHFDLSMQQRTDNPVSRNVGWLDFTHGITFANAVRNSCEAAPGLWPNGLAQMACFAGRNAGFLDRGVDETEWCVAEPLGFIDQELDGLFDHGEEEHIVLCHHLKTLTAAREEIAAAPDAAWVPTLAAALNRFLNSPLKRRHAQRTAQQALAFVAQEG